MLLLHIFIHSMSLFFADYKGEMSSLGGLGCCGCRQRSGTFDIFDDILRGSVELCIFEA